MPKVHNILLAEDEENFGTLLKNYLELHNYRVDLFPNGNKALIGFRQGSYDLCLLDVMMPERDGFSLAEEIKKINEKVPVIFLTAKTQKDDMIRGYQLGADDYLTKPFDSDLLLCKITAVLNRRSAEKEEESDEYEFRIGKFEFNSKMRELTCDGNTRKLSPREAELLRMLCLRKNDVLPREEALNKIWKDCSYFTTRSMDVFIAKLRKYLKQDPAVQLVNLHGNGFRLLVPEGDCNN